MDISMDEHEMNVSHPEPLSKVLQVIKGVSRRLIGFFILSDEDQVKAGVAMSDDGHSEENW